MLEEGGGVGGVLMLDLPLCRHMKTLEHHVYHCWSSFGECGAWSLLRVQEVLQLPLR
jgi:hypothetical protein